MATFVRWRMMRLRSLAHIVKLLRDPEGAALMAERARAEVVAKRDMRVMTERLVECYRDTSTK